jgi:hypothetical protein
VPVQWQAKPARQAPETKRSILDRQTLSEPRGQPRSCHRARRGLRLRCPVPRAALGAPSYWGTEAEALEEMRQAIQFHLDGLREDGQPIPDQSTVAVTVISWDAA